MLATLVDRLLVTQVDRFPDGDSEPVLTLLCVVFHEKNPPGRRSHIRLCIRRHLQLDFSTDQLTIAFFLWSPTSRKSFALLTVEEGVKKRCRLSWLTNSALVYEP